MSTVNKLLDDLNTLKGLKYPDIGYSYLADIKGDGTNNKMIWEIVNTGGGVTRSHMNHFNKKIRCDKVRTEIKRVQLGI